LIGAHALSSLLLLPNPPVFFGLLYDAVPYDVEKDQMIDFLVFFFDTHDLELLDRLPLVMWNWQPVRLPGGRLFGTNTTLIVIASAVANWYGSRRCYCSIFGKVHRVYLQHMACGI